MNLHSNIIWIKPKTLHLLSYNYEKVFNVSDKRMIQNIFFIYPSVTCGADEFFSCTSWIGGNDMNVEGSYVWDHSNTSLVYTNWHPQEPSLLHPSDASTRDCIDLLRSGRWNDRPCLYSNTFICEKTIGD